MDYTKQELLEAGRQIESTVHKLRETLKTLEGKEERARYKSQITLAGRRIEAFTIALSLIEREIENCEWADMPPGASVRRRRHALAFDTLPSSDANVISSL